MVTPEASPAVKHSTHPYVRLIATATLATVISACTPDATPPLTPEPDRFAALEADAKVMSHRWTAPTGIDLDSPEVQVARGYIESENNYDRTADPNTLYPRYTDIADIPRSPATPRTGTIDHHILQVESTMHQGLPATEIHVYDVYMQTAEPTATGWTRMERRAYMSILIQQSERTIETTPILGDEHRLPYPTWNVFDGWEVDRFTDMRMDDDDPWSICVTRTPGYRIPAAARPYSEAVGQSRAWRM